MTCWRECVFLLLVVFLSNCCFGLPEKNGAATRLGYLSSGLKSNQARRKRAKKWKQVGQKEENRTGQLCVMKWGLPKYVLAKRFFPYLKIGKMNWKSRWKINKHCGDQLALELWPIYSVVVVQTAAGWTVGILEMITKDGTNEKKKPTSCSPPLVAPGHVSVEHRQDKSPLLGKKGSPDFLALWGLFSFFFLTL